MGEREAAGGIFGGGGEEDGIDSFEESAKPLWKRRYFGKNFFIFRRSPGSSPDWRHRSFGCQCQKRKINIYFLTCKSETIDYFGLSGIILSSGQEFALLFLYMLKL